MLKKVKDFVIDNFKKIDNKITIDDIKEYSNKKLELVLSSNEYMASISIISDFTYDFLTIEIVSENIIINSTEICGGINDLLTRIEEHILQFSKL